MEISLVFNLEPFVSSAMLGLSQPALSSVISDFIFVCYNNKAIIGWDNSGLLLHQGISTVTLYLPREV